MAATSVEKAITAVDVEKTAASPSKLNGKGKPAEEVSSSTAS